MIPFFSFISKTHYSQPQFHKVQKNTMFRNYQIKPILSCSTACQLYCKSNPSSQIENVWSSESSNHWKCTLDLSYSDLPTVRMQNVQTNVLRKYCKPHQKTKLCWQTGNNRLLELKLHFDLFSTLQMRERGEKKCAWFWTSWEKTVFMRNYSQWETSLARKRCLCWKTVPAERCVVTIFELTFVADDKLFVHRALLSSWCDKPFFLYC